MHHAKPSSAIDRYIPAKGRTAAERAPTKRGLCPKACRGTYTESIGFGTLLGGKIPPSVELKRKRRLVITLKGSKTPSCRFCPHPHKERSRPTCLV